MKRMYQNPLLFEDQPEDYDVQPKKGLWAEMSKAIADMDVDERQQYDPNKAMPSKEQKDKVKMRDELKKDIIEKMD